MAAVKIFVALLLGLERGPVVADQSLAVREETVALPFSDGFNVTVPLQDGPGPHLGGAGATVLAAFFGLVLGCTGCIFLAVACNTRDRLYSFMQSLTYKQLASDEPGTDDAQLKRRLFIEAAIALLLPYVALALGSVWSLQGTAPPAWLVILLAGPAVVRAAWLERRVLLARGLELQPVPFAASKLELADAVSDGLAVAAAAALGPEARARFAASLGQLLWLQRLLGPVGLAGALAASLSFATALQTMGLFFVMAASPHQYTKEVLAGCSTAADLAGLGALASTLNPEASSRAFMMGMLRAVGEAGPQALLQTSVLMATGQSVLAQPTVLASVLLSLGTLCLKAWGLAKVAITAEDSERCTAVSFVTPGILLLLGIALLGGTKLLMVERCPERLWGLSTGCTGLASQ